VSLEEDEDSGDGREEQFKSRMSRMIEKQKEVTLGIPDSTPMNGARRAMT
jgi:hypothetical protein